MIPPSVADLPEGVFLVCDKRELGRPVEVETLQGGMVNLTRRIATDQGRSFILKTSPTPIPDLYPAEADGLRVIGASKTARVPEVYSVGRDHIMLEDFGSHPKEATPTSVALGRGIAALHENRGSAFGYHIPNYLGLLRMDNSWCEDGHDFFARTRILRFLEEPLCDEALSSEDRSGVERLASRLKDLIPEQPPCLLHGDLWHGNVVATSDGEPVVIDPAVYYGWPEAELSMTMEYGHVGDEFLPTYLELHPLESGYEERFKLLNIKELLSMTAHWGNRHGTVQAIRELLKRFLG